MTPVISVVIPTHNPRMDYLARVIEALKQQTLPCEQWEIVVVDNGSKQPLRAGIQHAATGAERRWVARQPNGIREEGALAGVGGQESGPPARRASRSSAETGRKATN